MKKVLAIAGVLALTVRPTASFSHHFFSFHLLPSHSDFIRAIYTLFWGFWKNDIFRKIWCEMVWDSA